MPEHQLTESTESTTPAAVHAEEATETQTEVAEASKDEVTVKEKPSSSGKKGIVLDKTHLRDSIVDLKKSRKIGKNMQLYDEVDILNDEIQTDSSNGKWYNAKAGDLTGYIRAEKVKVIATIKENLFSVDGGDATKKLVDEASDGGAGFLVRNFRFFRKRKNKELSETEKGEHGTALSEYIQGVMLSNSLISGVSISNRIFTKDCFLFDAQGTANILDQNITFTANFKSNFSTSAIDLIGLNINGFVINFGKTLSIDVNDISFARIDNAFQIKVSKINLTLNVADKTVTALVSDFAYDQTGGFSFSSVKIDLADTVQLGSLPVYFSNLGITISKEEPKFFNIHGTTDVKTDTINIGDALTFKWEQGTIAVDYSTGTKHLSMALSNANFSGSIAGQTIAISNFKGDSTGVKADSGNVGINIGSGKYKGNIEVTNPSFLNREFNFTEAKGTINDLSFADDRIKLTGTTASLLKTGNNYIVKAETDIKAENLVAPGIDIKRAQGHVAASYNKGDSSFNFALTNAEADATFLGQNLEIKNMSYDETGLKADSAKMNLIISGYTGSIEVIKPHISKGGFLYDSAIGKIDDISIAGGKLSLKNIEASIDADKNIIAESDISATDINPGASISLTEASGHLKLTKLKAKTGFDFELTNGKLKGSFIDQEIDISNVTANKEKLSADQANLKLNVSGYGGEVDITAPVIDSSGFDFSKASGKFDDITIGGNILSFRNIKATIGPDRIITAETDISSSDLKAGSIFSLDDASGHLKATYAKSDKDLNITITGGNIDAKFLQQQFHILNFSADKEKISADKTQIDLNILGKTGQIVVDKPQLSKQGFNFDKAEGTLQDISLLNDKMTLAGPKMSIVPKGSGKYDIKGEGLLTVNFFPGASGTVDGGFNWDGTSANPFLNKAKLDYSGVLAIPGFTGLSFKDMSITVLNVADVNRLAYSIGATIVYSHTSPNVNLETAMVLTIDEKGKLGFTITEGSLTTAMGSVKVFQLEYADKKITADRGEFGLTVGVPESVKGYFADSGLGEINDLFGFGINFDLGANDIVLSTAGLKIGTVTKSIRDIKFNLFGFEVAYDFAQKKGKIASKVDIPGLLFNKLPSLSISIPVYPGVSVFFAAGIRSEGKTNLSLEVWKGTDGAWNAKLAADLGDVTVTGYVEGGAKLGYSILAAIKAGLEASGNLKFATGLIEAISTFEPNTGSDAKSKILPKPKDFNLNYNFDIPVSLALKLFIEFQALVFFKKRFSINLIEREITRLEKRGSIKWSNSSGSPNKEDPALAKKTNDSELISQKPNESNLRDIQRMHYLSKSIIDSANFPAFNAIVTELDANSENIRARLQTEHNDAGSATRSLGNIGRLVMKGVVNADDGAAMKNGSKSLSDAESLIQSILRGTYHNKLLMEGITQDDLNRVNDELKSDLSKLLNHDNYSRLKSTYIGKINSDYKEVEQIQKIIGSGGETSGESGGEILENEKLGIYKYFTVKSNVVNPYNTLASNVNKYSELSSSVGEENISGFIAQHKGRLAIFSAANVIKKNFTDTIGSWDSTKERNIGNFITAYNQNKQHLRD